MTDLQGLLERVRQAEGPDRDLDWDIGKALNQKRDVCEQDPWTTDWTYPRYSSSIDYALALVSRLLPDRWWVLNSGVQSGQPTCLIGGKVWIMHEGNGAIPSLAILAALLTCLIAQAESDP